MVIMTILAAIPAAALTYWAMTGSAELKIKRRQSPSPTAGRR